MRMYLSRKRPKRKREKNRGIIKVTEENLDETNKHPAKKIGKKQM